MKHTLKILGLLSILTGLLMTNCVKDDFDKPEIPDPCKQKSGFTPNITVKGINDLFSKLDSVESSMVRIFPDTNLVLEAKVVSSDAAGNFYRVLYLEDETGAVNLSINGSDLFNDFPIGQTVHLNLKGLTIEFDDWVSIYEIGMGTFIDDGAVKGIGRIPVSSLESFLKRNSCPTNLTPKIIDLRSINNANLGRLVKLEDVQFIANDTGKTFANPESSPPENISLYLEDSQQSANRQIILRTSGYASFAGTKVPKGRGSIVGVYTKYGNHYQLIINDISDINFNKIRFGELEVVGESKIVNTLNETFEDGTQDEKYILGGWLNANIKGERYWESNLRNGNKALIMSGFNASANDIEAWLVSPGVAITEGQKLNFDTEVAYWKHNALSVFISTNFDGTHENLTSSTWEDVTDQLNLPVYPWNNFETGTSKNSEVDLSAYSGKTIYVLFKYTGNNSSDITKVEIDNVIISDL